MPVPVATWDIFDVGVVDLHGDGNLGIFTTNHNASQSLLANDGCGQFRDVLTEVGLDQDAEFPGWEEEQGEPRLAQQGLYVYRRRNTVVLLLHGADTSEPVAGTLQFACPATVLDGSMAAVATGAADAPTIAFTARAGERLCVVPELVALPLVVSVDGLAASSIFVGPRAICPTAVSFALRLRDRHAMAWGDFGGSGGAGVFVGRGGLKGRMAQYPGLVHDELFCRRRGGFENVWHRSGMAKGGCRSRQAAWVDIDGDNRLELFVSCAKGPPQLYRQDDDGQFCDVAGDLGLGEIRGGTCAWIDVDGDGRPELVVARAGELTVYAREAETRFSRSHVVRLRDDGWVPKLAVADFNGDGYPDVFAPSRQGNTLVVNDGGRLRATDPALVGLPGAGGITANWVDFDNDGLVDLHVLPGGLYRQHPGGTFARCSHLDGLLPTDVADARVSWFDAYNDGSRHALVATTSQPRVRGGDFSWTARLLRSAGTRNHWLQVQLLGPSGNRDGIGAAVRVRGRDGTATQWVGSNEGSHYSQGHYRTYFGLGDESVASVGVSWPDGRSQSLPQVAADQLLAIRYDDGP